MMPDIQINDKNTDSYTDNR